MADYFPKQSIAKRFASRKKAQEEKEADYPKLRQNFPEGFSRYDLPSREERERENETVDEPWEPDHKTEFTSEDPYPNLPEQSDGNPAEDEINDLIDRYGIEEVLRCIDKNYPMQDNWEGAKSSSRSEET